MPMPSDPHRAPDAPKLSHTETTDHRESKAEDADLGVKVDAGAVLEGVDSGEDGAEAMSNVSEGKESIGEHRHATGGKFQQFQKQLTDEEAKMLKEKLLKSPPKKRQMVQQIRDHVNREIHLLQRQASKHERKGAYHDLALVVRRMRELRGILIQLLYATAETIKHIWLKVVHGIV